MSSEALRGGLFVLSAPSGAGKATVQAHAFAGPLAGIGDLEISVSHTTRDPRPGEVDGEHYHFVDEATFRAMVDAEAFLEWAVYQGRYYGTSKAEVEERRDRGVDVIVEIEMQGAEQLLRRCPEAWSILILPPSFAELERRLVGRASESAEEIAGRLAVSVGEIRRYELYQYVIVNADVDRAACELAAVVLEKRLRLDRMRSRVREILQEFESALEDQ